MLDEFWNCGIARGLNDDDCVAMIVGVIAPAQRAEGMSMLRANISVGKRNVVRRPQAARAAEMLFHA